MRGVLVWLLVLPLAAGTPLAALDRTVPGDEPLDVVAQGQAWPGSQRIDFRMAPAFLPVPGGFRGLVSDPLGGGGCTLLEVDDRLSPRASVTVQACAGAAGLGVLVAADAQQTLLCRRDVPVNAPLVLLVDGTGTPDWTVSAEQLGGLGQGAAAWACNGGVLDGDVVVVALQQSAQAGFSGRHAVAAIDRSTGAVVWSNDYRIQDTAVGVAGSGILVRPTVLGSDATAGSSNPQFAPLTVTATESGYLVLGDVGSASGLLLLHKDGAYEHFLHAAETPFGRPVVQVEGTVVDQTLETLPPPRASGWAAPTGASGVLAFAGDVVQMDPTAPAPVSRAPLDLPFPFEPHAALGPLSLGDAFLIPLQNGIVAVDRFDFTLRWTHRVNPLPSYALWDLAATDAGHVWVVGDASSAQGRTPVAQLLDARTGRLLQQLPLPLDSGTAFDSGSLRLVAFDDGVHVIDRSGAFVTLAPAANDLKPVVKPDDIYPAVGDVIGLAIAPPPGTNTTVFWGDGRGMALPATGRAEASYADAGDRTVRVTSVFPDGRTATTALVLQVGGEAPQRLNLLQRAFSDANQEMTWGIIGLVLAALSGIGTVAAVLWRRRGLAADLRRIDAIRQVGRSDPLAAAAELQVYRADLRQRAAKGKLQAGDFASLTQEAIALSQALQRRVMGQFGDRLPKQLQATLDHAMVDGALSPTESARIAAALQSAGRLTESERIELTRLLGAWT